jgi:hypothetical protein
LHNIISAILIRLLPCLVVLGIVASHVVIGTPC